MSWDYYEDPREDLQAVIDPRGKRCLDVGCGAGALGAALKAAGAVHVAGIELDAEAAARARTRLDALLEGSVPDVDLASLGGEFDVIVFADVLEHLPDPDAALRRCLLLLADGGRVVVSVPNMRFWLVLLRLVADRWEYAEHGVRDRTHLRIITRRSLLRLLAAHGLEPEAITRNQRLFDDQSRIGRTGALASRVAVATLGRSPLRELLTYQYVVVARRAPVTARTLLVGPTGHGGEGVYMETLATHAPDGVEYVRAGGFHEGAPGVSCAAVRERLLNRVVRRFAIPDMGFRALRVAADFDLVHVHAHPVQLRGRVPPLVMSEGSSAVVYLSEYLGWDEPALARGLRRGRRLYRALGIADRLLTLERATGAYVFSDWAREINVRWGADPAKLRVIAPGFPTPAAVERVHDGFTFLFVGSDFERKGGFELIEAFARAAAERPDLRLVLAGSDPAVRNPDRDLHGWVDERRRARGLETIATLKRDGLLRSVEQVTREVLLADIYPAVDAFVMPTHAEGFGFTNVEAMSFGLPVVTSTAGPAAEIVADGTTGVLVAPGDVERLTEVLLELASDPQRARAMGAAGRDRFLERFTIERFRADLGLFYREALERG